MTVQPLGAGGSRRPLRRPTHCATMPPAMEQPWGWDEGWQRADLARRFNTSAVTLHEAACVDAGCLWLESRPGSIYVTDLQVLPSFQRKGIATSILRDLQSRADARGIAVALAPGVSRGFYEKSSHGLHVIGHSGDTQWFHSNLALVPEHNFGIFVSYVTNGGRARGDARLPGRRGERHRHLRVVRAARPADAPDLRRGSATRRGRRDRAGHRSATAVAITVAAGNTEQQCAAYEREAPTVVVDVRVREDQAWRLDQVFGRGTVGGAERVGEGDQPGTIRLRIRLGYPDEVPGLLLAVGHNLEVLDPPEIRDKVVMLANRIAARYRAAAPVDARRGSGRSRGCGRCRARNRRAACRRCRPDCRSCPEKHRYG